jgi:hypothetical protein
MAGCRGSGAAPKADRADAAQVVSMGLTRGISLDCDQAGLDEGIRSFCLPILVYT